MKELFERIRAAAKADPADNMGYLSYMTEEVGEVGTCLAVEYGMKNRELNETKEQECCDVLICTLGLLLRNDEWDYDTVVKYMEKKLRRWEKRLTK